jgi:hypothetical protein
MDVDAGANAAESKDAGAGAGADDGHKVIVVSGLTKNVHRGHLMEIFEVYGRVTGLDLPLFKVCEWEWARGSARGEGWSDSC